MSTAYKSAIDLVRELKQKHGNWQNISEVDAARMMSQNRFKTGLDIAKYTTASKYIRINPVSSTFPPGKGTR